ncbi:MULTISPECIES: hypothetical protein [unclassified Agarivorans]|uniref:hypothetical protein n=1 Tax=unclassified Agarivorans TaxID=2636026 RepID=UPI0026E14E74|nr:MULTISPECIES: hypothetical protein [unclassified Agarivorans]MDO6687949.1 hypothetical protein [Agarivorans sp. 3_MG-2023]MDO6717571.1 hypothetical protein [Agarivorans sp. 2_MG-2023]
MKTLTLASLLLVCSYSATASINDQQLASYYQAAQGDYSQLDQLYKELQKAHQQQPTDPWTLFYLGGTETFKGDDAWLPWTKMSYTEDGLARIDKALNMITEQQWQQQYRYLPQAIYMQATAAVTFTKVPDFFNYQQQGMSLFKQVLNDSRFLQSPAQATSWVFSYAIEAALDAEQPELAEQWFSQLKQRGLNDEFGKNAEQLMTQHAKG